MQRPMPSVSLLYTGFQSDEPEFLTRNGEDVLLIIFVGDRIEDEAGTSGWDVTCEDGIGYDCFWSEKLGIFVYSLD